jgi:hypothetical protein
MNQYRKHVGLVICSLALLLFAQSALAADVSGEWEIVYDTEGGERTGEMAIKADGETVTAKMGVTELKGTFKDGELKLKGEHYADEAGYKAELTFTGKFDGDKIKGDASWDAYEMTFVASRK